MQSLKPKTTLSTFQRKNQAYANLKSFSKALIVFALLFMWIEFGLMLILETHIAPLFHGAAFNYYGFCLWHSLLTSVLTSIIIALGLCFNQTSPIPMIKAFKAK